MIYFLLLVLIPVSLCMAFYELERHNLRFEESKIYGLFKHLDHCDEETWETSRFARVQLLRERLSNPLLYAIKYRLAHLMLYYVLAAWVLDRLR